MEGSLEVQRRLKTGKEKTQWPRVSRRTSEQANPHQAQLIEGSYITIIVDPAVMNQLAGEWRTSREQVAMAPPQQQTDSIPGKR